MSRNLSVPSFRSFPWTLFFILKGWIGWTWLGIVVQQKSILNWGILVNIVGSIFISAYWSWNFRLSHLHDQVLDKVLSQFLFPFEITYISKFLDIHSKFPKFIDFQTF